MNLRKKNYAFLKDSVRAWFAIHSVVTINTLNYACSKSIEYTPYWDYCQSGQVLSVQINVNKIMWRQSFND